MVWGDIGKVETVPLTSLLYYFFSGGDFKKKTEIGLFGEFRIVPSFLFAFKFVYQECFLSKVMKGKLWFREIH